MESASCSGQELLTWRRRQLLRGGRAVDLDWLLAMEANLSWAELQRLRILPESIAPLASTLEELEKLWVVHLQNHVPLQHLVGRCPWRDLDLRISPAALIPRQETELLIDFALDCLQDSALAGNASAGRWADLGTGSGALAVALARALPGWDGHAVDLSAAALELAGINLNALTRSLSCKLHQGSWWDPLEPWWGQFDLVVANPPYIPSHVVDELDPLVRDHEPRQALCGGEDGLDGCRAILDLAPQALSPGGWLLLEHHHDQSDQVLGLMRSAGLVLSTPRSDLSGVNRFAVARRRL
ncbi:peptide chain release factor N(5)-glutamine methyltransferase [Synechococcus sp. UW179A]|uniref:peptide chain release factor N(5)-glutamine methyltransferase n=1 Tax=Synechococcus sp. UW179A TaxID=2575510 RepID=UPI000E0E1406|nr:peptide chain release factor N(5)-glutamine methyltransferase [Synechococcus sp. UW179A]